MREVVPTFPLPDAAVSLLSRVAIVAGPENRRGELHDAHACIRLLADPIDPALLDAAPNLAIVANAELPNAVLVPRIGSAARDTGTRVAMMAARDGCAVLRGEPPLTPVRA